MLLVSSNPEIVVFVLMDSSRRNRVDTDFGVGENEISVTLREWNRHVDEKFCVGPNVDLVSGKWG